MYYHNLTIMYDRCIWGKKDLERFKCLTAKLQALYLQPYLGCDLREDRVNSHTHIQLSHSLTRNSGEEIHIPKNIIPKSSFFFKKIVILNRKMIIIWYVSLILKQT